MPTAQDYIDKCSENWPLPLQTIFPRDTCPSHNPEQWDLTILAALADLSELTGNFREVATLIEEMGEFRGNNIAADRIKEGVELLRMREEDVKEVFDKLGGCEKLNALREENMAALSRTSSPMSVAAGQQTPRQRTPSQQSDVRFARPSAGLRSGHPVPLRDEREAHPPPRPSTPYCGDDSPKSRSASPSPSPARHGTVWSLMYPPPPTNLPINPDSSSCSPSSPSRSLPPALTPTSPSFGLAAPRQPYVPPPSSTPVQQASNYQATVEEVDDNDSLFNEIMADEAPWQENPIHETHAQEAVTEESPTPESPAPVTQQAPIFPNHVSAVPPHSAPQQAVNPLLDDFGRFVALRQHFQEITRPVMPPRLIIDPEERARLRARAKRNMQKELEILTLGMGAMVHKRGIDEICDEEADEAEEAAKRARRS
jgi:hypothetical protein